MTRKSIPAAAVFTLLCLCVRSLSAQPLPDYHNRSAFLFAPAAVFEDGLPGFSNPAGLAFLSNPELQFHWTTDGDDVLSLQDWGAFAAVPYFGVAMQRQKPQNIGVTDFKISGAVGGPAFAFGVGYGWSSGRQDALGREKLVTLGTISRPLRLASFGLSLNQSLESSAREGVAELGIRPLGTNKLTFFADAALQKGRVLKDAVWSTGVVVQPIPGVQLVGRYFDSQAFSLGFAINFGKRGIGSRLRFDADAHYHNSQFFVRSGGLKTSFVQQSLQTGSRYAPFVLTGEVSHLKYRLFDDSGNQLFKLLRDIQAAAADPRVRTIAVNLSGASIRAEYAWELREQLKAAQRAGKLVVAFIDQAGLTQYHLASVADKVVMDPQGALHIRGYAMSRTYFKGTLDKLGLGFDEWRFFKYKSVNEMLSRTDMSEADREQNQAFVDDLYENTRTDICQSRNFTAAVFDSLIDDESYLLAPQAVAAGLVDTLARWSGVQDILKKFTGTNPGKIAHDDLLENALAAPEWGRPPEIAVVYGLGICALDGGIRARWLERVFLGLAENPNVKAIVFRVDSPGGDGMASDLVAEAIRKCRENKPVIISQGQVAASGGYWLSMYGDEILAGPVTVTGSIGVIFGWLYDKGFGEKIGATSDLVKRGEHADLGQGIELPFTGLELPGRNLNEEERARIEEIIRQYYSEFVNKVAEGREMPVERVQELAEGRIYSGIDALNVGLVDKIGGLADAISLAKEHAGFAPDDRVKILEIPADKGWFDLRRQFLPAGFHAPGNDLVQTLRFLSEHNGAPLPLLTPGGYPE